MTRTTTALALGLITSLGGVALAAARQLADEQEIRRIVTEYYFEGGRHGDSARVRQAFNLDVAHMLFVQNGALQDVPIPEYVRRVGANGARPDFRPDTNQRRVVMVDVAGNAAIAKLETVAGATTLVDYMSLLKVGGRWQVVTKIYDRLPTAPRP